MMVSNPRCSTLRPAAVISTLLALVLSANSVSAADSIIHVKLHLQESTTIAERVYNGNSAQLMLNGYNLNHIGIASVNGTKIELRRDQPETIVELRLEGRRPSVCRIQAGDASIKFIASPGQFLMCSMATSVAETETEPATGPTQPVPDTPSAEPAAVSPATIDPKIVEFLAELNSNLEEENRLYTEAYRLQNDLNQADARKREFEAYQIEIAELAKKRDAIIAIRDNFWVLQKKTNGIIDVPDATGGVILSELELAIKGIDARKRVVEKLGPMIKTDNENAPGIHDRLQQISAGRSSLERRRTELKKAIP